MTKNKRLQKHKETKEINWEEAKDHLNLLIAEYCAIGWIGEPGLQVLIGLKRKIDSGERSLELYNIIMDCK